MYLFCRWTNGHRIDEAPVGFQRDWDKPIFDTVQQLNINQHPLKLCVSLFSGVYQTPEFTRHTEFRGEWLEPIPSLHTIHLIRDYDSVIWRSIFYTFGRAVSVPCTHTLGSTGIYWLQLLSEIPFFHNIREKSWKWEVTSIALSLKWSTIISFSRLGLTLTSRVYLPPKRVYMIYMCGASQAKTLALPVNIHG